MIKLADANSNSERLNRSIKSEINSTINKLEAGETKRVGIKTDVCNKVQDKLYDITGHIQMKKIQGSYY